MKSPVDDSMPPWRQTLLPLSQTVTVETRRRLVLIPNRSAAENERDKLIQEHGAAMIAAKIRKQGKAPSGTYTLAYSVREAREEPLFQPGQPDTSRATPSRPPRQSTTTTPV
jgi:hypothetical protein